MSFPRCKGVGIGVLTLFFTLHASSQVDEGIKGLRFNHFLQLHPSYQKVEKNNMVEWKENWQREREKTGLTLMPVREWSGGGHRYLLYQELYQSYPVLGARAALGVDPEGTIFTLYSTLVNIQPPQGEPFLTAEEASQLALQALNGERMRGRVEVYRAVLVRDSGSQWVWVVELPCGKPLGDWEVIVDGSSGEIIRVEDHIDYLQSPALVFDPDPKSALGVDTLQDRDDRADAVPQEAYQRVDLGEVERDEEGRFVLVNRFVDLTLSPSAAREQESLFLFYRDDLRFEQVMGFYHISRFARYIEELGFEGLPYQPIRVAANGVEEDLSFFSPLTRTITTGRGGVDDGEDADVWAHEFTHTLIHRILPRWRGGERGILTEGVCDYFAGYWSWVTAPDFQPEWIYNWDGHNQFWSGRVLNAPYHYPEDAAREPHDAGQLWSALLTEVAQRDDDRNLWNRVIITHLFLLGDSVTVPEAAFALLESDRRVAGFRFRRFIVEGCERRGIFPVGLFRPRLIHQPQPDIEEFRRPIRIRVEVSSSLPLDSSQCQLLWRKVGDREEIALFQQDGDSIWIAEIPPPEEPGYMEYRIQFRDISGIVSYLPSPEGWYQFYVGDDLIPPRLLSWDDFYQTPFIKGERWVWVRTVDNRGVGRVWWSLTDGNGGLVNRWSLFPVAGETGLYKGKIWWELDRVPQTQFQIVVEDISRRRNRTISSFWPLRWVDRSVVEDFEEVPVRWILQGFRRDSSMVYQGRWALVWRGEDGEGAGENFAELDEFWDLAGLGSAEMIFWEQHLSGGRPGAELRLEISKDSGRTWEEWGNWGGDQQFWMERRINLSPLAQEGGVAFRFRFSTSRGRPMGEVWWAIDQISLRVGNVVSSKEEKPYGRGRLEFYPQPANSHVILRLNEGKGNIQLALYTAQGGLIKEDIITPQGTLVWDLMHLPTGVYFLVSKGEGIMRRNKLVLLR